MPRSSSCAQPFLLSPQPSNASALTGQRPRKPARRPTINRIATKTRSQPWPARSLQQRQRPKMLDCEPGEKATSRWDLSDLELWAPAWQLIFKRPVTNSSCTTYARPWRSARGSASNVERGPVVGYACYFHALAATSREVRKVFRYAIAP